MDYGLQNYVKQSGEMTGKAEGRKVRKGREFALLSASLPLCILTKLEGTGKGMPLDNGFLRKSGGNDYAVYNSSFGKKRKWRLTKSWERGTMSPVALWP